MSYSQPVTKTDFHKDEYVCMKARMSSPVLCLCPTFLSSLQIKESRPKKNFKERERERECKRTGVKDVAYIKINKNNNIHCTVTGMRGWAQTIKHCSHVTIISSGQTQAHFA